MKKKPIHQMLLEGLGVSFPEVPDPVETKINVVKPKNFGKTTKGWKKTSHPIKQP